MRYLSYLLGIWLGAASGVQLEQSSISKVYSVERLREIRSSATVRLKGVIDAKSVEKVENDFYRLREIDKERKVWLYIDSNGGDADALISLSEFVDQNFDGLLVKRRCYSACAELLMTVDKDVIISSAAEIKFHINPLMSVLLLERKGINPDECIAKRSHWYIRNFNAAISVHKFTMFIKDKLEFTGAVPTVSSSVARCPDYIFQSRNKFFVLDNTNLQNITRNRIRILSK